MTSYPASTLLCDANFSCIPLALNLLERGHRFTVCGNLHSDPCHRYGHSSLSIDYGDQALLLETAKEIGPKYLVAGCNDRSYLSCAYVAEQLGLPGYDSYETTLQLQEKDLFRAFAVRCGYPVPHLFEDPGSLEQAALPVLVKPTDAFSGRGISKVSDMAALPQALSNARAHSRSGSAVVEEFVSGSLHSHSAFIFNGRISLDFFVDEFCTVYDYQVNSSCLSSSLSERIRRDVRDSISQLVADLRLVDGLLHTQFLSDGERFWLIEVTRRCPGDLYSHLIRYSTGVDYAGLYVGGFLGESVPDGIGFSHVRHVARHTATTSSAGYLFGIRHQIPAAEVQVLQLKTCGDYLKAAPFDKAAILFADFANERQLALTTPLLKTFIHLDMLSSDGGSGVSMDSSHSQWGSLT